MSSLPGRPDLRQLRNQAKELKTAVNAGEEDALGRVFARHPKYAGRPTVRYDFESFSLRDAQVTIARELGFESWGELVTAVEVDARSASERRWDVASVGEVERRAMLEASRIGHEFCLSSHFLLAVLNPPKPTLAAEVLTELGADYEAAYRRLALMGGKLTEGQGPTSAPTYQMLKGWTQGLAVGSGAPGVTDEHVLLALAFGMGGGDADVWMLGIDPDDVIEGLTRRGVPVPSVRPAVAGPPIRMGLVVYFESTHHGAVMKRIWERFPHPGASSVPWGSRGQSQWKPGFSSVWAAEEISLEEIVRSIVGEDAPVLIVPIEEASANEARAGGEAGDE